MSERQRKNLERYNKRMIGRHCVICGKPGGAGTSFALRTLLETAEAHGIATNWHTHTLYDGKAHGSCIIKEKARIEALIPRQF